jgi:hypothetical protein
MSSPLFSRDLPDVPETDFGNKKHPSQNRIVSDRLRRELSNTLHRLRGVPTLFERPAGIPQGLIPRFDRTGSAIHVSSHFVRGPDRGHDDLSHRKPSDPRKYCDHFLSFFAFIQSQKSLPTMKTFCPFLTDVSPCLIQPRIVLRLDPTAAASASMV